MGKIGKSKILASVATPVPLRHTLSYSVTCTDDKPDIEIGARVRVPLGSRSVVGVVTAYSTDEDISGKIKPVGEALDTVPLFDESMLTLYNWVSDYYHYPVGQVYQYVLPALLRVGKKAELQTVDHWQLTAAGQGLDVAQLSRAPKQAALLVFLKNFVINNKGGAVSAQMFEEHFESWRSPLGSLVEKGWVEKMAQTRGAENYPPPLAALSSTPDQQSAIDAVVEDLSAFNVHLLHGVTGSGKTEVYLQIAQQVINQGKQVLLLVPEIGLTPQIVSRFQQRLSSMVVVLHSGLNDRERLNHWLLAKAGDAGVVIGTRSAVFTPMPNLGLIVIDEEHDASFKQQDGFRYSARDVAIKRAQMQGISIVLGSATPCLESFHNAKEGRYHYHELSERAGDAVPPSTQILDLRGQTLQDGMSHRLIASMKAHLAVGNQVMLFLNRRGFAPTLLCHACGWVSHCDRCDSHMTLYQQRKRQRCHHCGAERPVPIACPQCAGQDLIAVGEGTERVEEGLSTIFKDVDILRIDRDTTRRKGSLDAMLDTIHGGGAMILLGTQMLAKGHHFPDVTLVGILNVDQGLFSIDFRALERMAQLIVQVSGRAGRASKPGQVILQTHYPDHPLLMTLVQEGYIAFAKKALEERQSAGLPPFAYLALLRAESTSKDDALQFLQEARRLGESIENHGTRLLGPTPAPMKRRAGHYRAQLLIYTASRQQRHKFLSHWISIVEKSRVARKVRWSLDVDPSEMF